MKQTDQGAAPPRLQASHTSGPWEVVWSSNTNRPMELLGPGRRKIIRWGGLGEPASAETSANARLIAAAPALADMLLVLLSWAECDRTPTAENIADARAALRAAGRIAEDALKAPRNNP